MSTMARASAAAWFVPGADHHPDLAVGCDRCTVPCSTRSPGGLSLDDFVRAAKAAALLEHA